MRRPLRTSQRFRMYKEVRRELSRAYPEAFPIKGRRPPLKVGILRDIVADGARDLPVVRIRVFLSIWTRSTSYLESLSRRRPRVGLDGTPCGVVDAAHAKEAEACIEARRKRSQAFDRPS